MLNPVKFGRLSTDSGAIAFCKKKCSKYANQNQRVLNLHVQLRWLKAFRLFEGVYWPQKSRKSVEFRGDEEQMFKNNTYINSISSLFDCVCLLHYWIYEEKANKTIIVVIFSQDFRSVCSII